MHSLIRGVYFSITLKTIHRKDTYMKQPKLELLSPAGSWEALEAAVRSGADAVYLGGSLFSARANAQNFDHDTLKQAVAYCHARGVKVHLAVNTILLNHEIAPALDFVAFACTLPVDAVIVQDTGLLHLLRQAAPTLQIHASTQMSVHTRRRKTAGRTRRLTGCTGSRIIFKRNQRNFPGIKRRWFCTC